MSAPTQLEEAVAREMCTARGWNPDGIYPPYSACNGSDLAHLDSSKLRLWEKILPQARSVLRVVARAGA